MRQRPGAIQRTREGLSESSVSTCEGGERIGPRCPVHRDGMALGATKSKSTEAQRELGTCGSQSWLASRKQYRHAARHPSNRGLLRHAQRRTLVYPPEAVCAARKGHEGQHRKTTTTTQLECRQGATNGRGGPSALRARVSRNAATNSGVPRGTPSATKSR